MIHRGYFKPDWDIEEFKTLNYRFAPPPLGKVLDEFASVGHSKMYMTIFHCMQPNHFPSVVYDYILPQFDLSHVGVAANLLLPGQYLPNHIDYYHKYIEVHNLTDEPIRRYILFLEDSVRGQISQACGYTFGAWRAGDWIGWDRGDEHAVYNFSTVNRYALQITGVPNE